MSNHLGASPRNRNPCRRTRSSASAACRRRRPVDRSRRRRDGGAGVADRRGGAAAAFRRAAAARLRAAASCFLRAAAAFFCGARLRPCLCLARGLRRRLPLGLLGGAATFDRGSIRQRRQRGDLRQARGRGRLAWPVVLQGARALGVQRGRGGRGRGVIADGVDAERRRRTPQRRARPKLSASGTLLRPSAGRRQAGVAAQRRLAAADREHRALADETLARDRNGEHDARAQLALERAARA